MSKKKTVKSDETSQKDQEEILETSPEEELLEPVEEADEDVKENVLVLETALAEATGKAEEYLTMAQRVQADFDNFRRRNQNVRGEAFEDGAKSILMMLLPVLDNMERAMDAAAESEDKSLREGVEMVAKQLREMLEKRGVKAIERVGEKFDPALENAVLNGTPDDGEPGTVCEVFQKGYCMGDSVLRHAMVKVVPS